MPAKDCITSALNLELELWQRGIRFIAGIDEAGRGALAGPVSAAVVILPASPEIAHELEGVRDSKQMTAHQRERAETNIKAHALGWGVGFSSANEINQMGIAPATRQAVLRAIQQLPVTPEYLLMDFIHWPGLAHPHLALPKGESQSLSIAAASVLAKTARDAIMRQMDEVYPGYGFARHKGYGTLAHRQSILRMGACPEHRLKFIDGISA